LVHLRTFRVQMIMLYGAEGHWGVVNAWVQLQSSPETYRKVGDFVVLN